MYREIINSAFDAGIADAWGWWDMTPAEINGRIAAYRANVNQRLEADDAFAWMVGAYVAQGFHQPKRYPKKPNMVKVQKPKPKKAHMDDDSMKAMLEVFAKTQNAAEGVIS